MNEEIKMIPIDQIRILNSRCREKKKFEQVVQSICHLGLKKPIQVSLRSVADGEEPGYDLVCGQGRMEALVALGHKEVPAIVVDVSKEDRLLRSLVENIARRHPATLALIYEIERLKEAGYTNTEIARKLDFSEPTVSGLLTLKKAGEERLLDAAISGRIPLGVAMEIAKADTPEMQRELMKAYESKELNGFSIRTVKRLIDQRRFGGKERDHARCTQKPRTSAESMINAFKRESQRQKLLIKKARICEAKMLFVVTAFKKLLGDDNFITLLRAETLSEMPKYLHEKLDQMRKEAA